MELDSLEKLEAKITELTERYLALREEHEEVLRELTAKGDQIVELNEQLGEFQQSKVQINSKIENILKKLEFLKTQSDQ